MLKAWLRIILCRGLKDGNPCLKDQIGRPNTRWKYDVLEDIKNMNLRNWPYAYRGFNPTNAYRKEEIYDILRSG
jgi:hypothetical protein